MMRRIEFTYSEPDGTIQKHVEWRDDMEVPRVGEFVRLKLPAGENVSAVEVFRVVEVLHDFVGLDAQVKLARIDF